MHSVTATAEGTAAQGGGRAQRVPGIQGGSPGTALCQPRSWPGAESQPPALLAQSPSSLGLLSLLCQGLFLTRKALGRGQWCNQGDKCEKTSVPLRGLPGTRDSDCATYTVHGARRLSAPQHPLSPTPLCLCLPRSPVPSQGSLGAKFLLTGSGPGVTMLGTWKALLCLHGAPSQAVTTHAIRAGGDWGSP